MELDPEPFLSVYSLLIIQTYPVTPGVIVGFVAIGILLFGSALISGSEVAYFSLQPHQIEKIRQHKTKSSERAVILLKEPEKLLATILISNNFINIGIVMISTYITTSIFDFREDPLVAFLIQVVVVTFLLLVFGEIIPKIYANQNPLKFSLFISYPLIILKRVFSPVSAFLIRSTNIVNKRLSSAKQNLSMVDLSDALDLTTGFIQEDKKILKGIVKFSNIEVNEIMKPRLDVVAIDIDTKMNELIKIVNDSGFSRIPVYEETFDNIRGILYIKDLIQHLEKEDSFTWHSLIRPSYFVPGSKKINVLLQEFREKKIHLAIVVDEYGGTEGIVTLEDILEEIVGEITDESDEVAQFYSKIDDRNYIFDAKTLLNDFYKILHIQEDSFAKIRGEADTLAGLILELLGDLPNLNQVVKVYPFTFTIISVDNRRIKKVKVSLDKPVR